MPQNFKPWTNIVARAMLPGVVAATIVGALVAMLFDSSSYGTGAGVVVDQPVPFSHQHHAGLLGIDCRYCHTNVEQSSYAGMPSTEVCMNCHSQIWTGSQMLAPVRESYRTNKPLTWNRVYNLPDFVYFDHSIHVHKGVGCTTCHGQIDEMPLTQQVPPLLMQWCINCHRDPAPELRPREGIFSVDYQSSPENDALGSELMEQYHIRSETQLTSCSVCHR